MSLIYAKRVQLFKNFFALFCKCHNSRKFLAKTFACFFLIVITFSLCSCDSEVNIAVQENGNAIVRYDARLGNAFVNFLKSFYSFDDITSATNAPVLFFDTELMKKEFEVLGMKNVSVTSTSPSRLIIQGTVPLNNEKDDNIILASGCMNKDGNIFLNPKSLLALYSLLPSQIQQYADLFMAPVFVGDFMSKEEYVETLASLYGDELASEIKNAKVSVTLKNKNGKQVKKNLSLVDVLTISGKENIQIIAVSQ